VQEDFIHRVGRTGRMGARGTASTFGTRQERSEIAHIERTLGVRLTRREVSAAVPREEKGQEKGSKSSGPVIVIPAAARRFEALHKRSRNFGPRSRRAV